MKNNERTEPSAIRKRPATFVELIGQEFIFSTLHNSISNMQIAPAYLFSGPRGVGKTSSARLLALAVNHPEKPTVQGKFDYPGSEAIRKGNAVDVIEIDGASHTSVDHIRSIREEIMYPPQSLRYKVYIIDEVHMLSHSAFNALLKTIEEPPPHAMFIFATTEVHKIPATIRSRCQHFPFRLIPIPNITEALQTLCTEENITAEEHALQWIAKESSGSLRDAYTLFDQIAASCNKEITLQKIKDIIGIADTNALNTLVEYCIAENRKEALHTLAKIFAEGVSAEQFAIECAEYFRNALLIKSGVTEITVLGYTVEQFSQNVISSMSFDQIEYAGNLFCSLYKELRNSFDQHIEVEIAVSQLCAIKYYISPKYIHQHIRFLRKEIQQVKNNPSPQDSGDSSPQKSTTKKPVHAGPSTVTQESLFHTIIKEINSKDETLAVYMEKNCHIELVDNTMHIAYKHKTVYNHMKNNLALIETISRNITHKPQLHISFKEITESPQAHQETHTKESVNDKNSDFPEEVQKIKKLFGGTIKKVS